MEEIKIVTPQVMYEPSKVVYDFDELDTAVAEIEKRYSNWLPSEEEIKDAEKIAKDINGAAKQINDEKARIKKEMNKESKLLEDEAMLRVNRLKTVRTNIMESLEIYEQKRKAEKKEEIRSHFLNSLGELEIPFERIFKEEMLNKTYSKKQWQSDIKVDIEAVEQEYKHLDMMNVDDVPLLKSIYTQVWDRFVAIDKYNEQITARKRAEEIKRQQEDRKTAYYNTVKPVRKEPEYEIPLEFNDVTTTWRITGRADVISQAKRYLMSLGIDIKEV